MSKFNLDIPRIGYIVLFKHEGGWISNQIRKTQIKKGFKEENAIYTHSAISCGGPYIMEIAAPKSKVIDIRDKYYGKWVKILRYVNDEYQRKGRYKIALWSVSQSNLRYDWFGALALKFRIFWQWKSRPFCSENNLWAFQKEFPQSEAQLLPEGCMPAYWLTFREIEQIWEGYVE